MTTHTAKWMFGDATRMNPLKWSKATDIAAAILELEGLRVRQATRPIKLMIVGTDGREVSQQFAGVGGAIDTLRALQQDSVRTSSAIQASNQSQGSAATSLPFPLTFLASNAAGHLQTLQDRSDHARGGAVVLDCAGAALRDFDKVLFSVINSPEQLLLDGGASFAPCAGHVKQAAECLKANQVELQHHRLRINLCMVEVREAASEVSPEYCKQASSALEEVQGSLEQIAKVLASSGSGCCFSCFSGNGRAMKGLQSQTKKCSELVQVLKPLQASISNVVDTIHSISDLCDSRALDIDVIVKPALSFGDLLDCKLESIDVIALEGAHEGVVFASCVDKLEGLRLILESTVQDLRKVSAQLVTFIEDLPHRLPSSADQRIVLQKIQALKAVRLEFLIGKLSLVTDGLGKLPIEDARKTSDAFSKDVSNLREELEECGGSMCAAVRAHSAPILQVRSRLNIVGSEGIALGQALSALSIRRALDQLSQSTGAVPPVISNTVGNLVGLPDEIMKLKMAMKRAPGMLNVDTTPLQQAADVNGLNTSCQRLGGDIERMQLGTRDTKDFSRRLRDFSAQASEQISAAFAPILADRCQDPKCSEENIEPPALAALKVNVEVLRELDLEPFIVALGLVSESADSLSVEELRVAVSSYASAIQQSASSVLSNPR